MRVCDIIALSIVRHTSNVLNQRISVGGVFSLSSLRCSSLRTVLKTIVRLKLLNEIPEMLTCQLLCLREVDIEEGEYLYINKYISKTEFN